MIPVYNELDNCRVVIPELQDVLRRLGVDYHVLLVVAGDDGTREYVDMLGDERVQYIYEGDRPTGLGNAYNSGYRASLAYDPDVIVSLDGDGNHDPVLLESMFALIDEGYEVVVGSRYIAAGGYTHDVDLPVYKVFLSKWVNIFLSFVLGLHVVDKSSGYRCVRASFVHRIVDEWHPVGFSHQVYLLWLWSFMGANIVEIAQQHRPRKYGQSKFPLWSTLCGYAVLCRVIWKRKFF